MWYGSGELFPESAPVGPSLLFRMQRHQDLGISQVMQVHVEDGGGQQFGSHETLVECFLVQYLFNQAVGNDFAGLVMLGIHFQHFGFGSPMLVDLRGEFHEVAYDIGA